MYADDAAIFLKKTSLTPISCSNIDLDSILADFPVSQANFPIKYLGLPLTPRRLKKLDFQPLLDKAVGKLSAWNGRSLTQAGRVCLTKLVLSSQPVYHLTVLKPPLEVMQELDKIRRRFLWAGDKAISGGKCKMNWRKKHPSKGTGRPGVLDLDKFARALRLHWLWQQWTSPDKVWEGTDVVWTSLGPLPRWAPGLTTR
jgi:hypothetical protein